jgi:PAS domain S-box-containing protein
MDMRLKMDSPKILIVEDEAIIAQDLKSTLSHLDYQVVGMVSSGEDAIAILEQSEADVILMDIRIKGTINGIETTEQINKRFDVPVIFLTAYADEKTMEQIKGIDAYGFIVKPASEQTIQGSIDLALFKHSLNLKLREREERLEHLNHVLKAIRNVHKLITKEDDVRHLIQEACNNLIESLGYSRAWIALYNGNQALSRFAYAGFDNSFDNLEGLLRGEPSQYPPCIRNAFKHPSEMVVNDVVRKCKGCPLAKESRNYSRFSKCLNYGGKIFGVMSVAVPSIFVFDEEEQALFSELVDDVAFALYRIELEEKRTYAEKMLQVRERTLATLMNNLPGMTFRCLDDDEWTMKFVSNGCKALTGYQPIQLINNKKVSFRSLIHPEDLAMVRKRIQNSTVTKHQYELVYRIYTAAGNLKWVWERGSRTGEQEEGFKILEGVIHDITEQKTAEDALSKEQAFTQTALNAQTDTFIVFNPETGNPVRWNRALENVTGYSHEEIAVIQMPTALVEPGARQKAKSFLAQLKNTKEGTVELPLLSKSGQSIPYEYRVTTIQDYETQKGLLVAVGRDISERLKNEAALKESEERYRVLVENMTDFVFLINQQNQILSINQSASRFLKRKSEEVIGLSIFQIFPEALAKNYAASISRVFKSGEPVIVERKAELGENSIWLFASLSPIKDESGKVTAVIGTSRDITQRKLMEEALIQSEARYRAIVEDQTELVLRWLPDGTLTYVNPAYCRFYEKSYDELINTNFFPILRRKELVQLKSRIRTLTRENPVSVSERYTECADGPVYWHLWMERAIFDDSGKICELQSVGRDITQRKMVEDELRYANVRMKAVLENTDELIMIADHKGQPVMYNSAYARMVRRLTGIEMKPGLQPHRQFNDPEVRDWWDKQYKRVLKGEKFNVEFSYHASDGQLNHYDIHFYPIFEENEVRGFTEYSRDITERKDAEEALRKSEKLLMRIAENYPHSYLSIINKDYTVGFTSGQEFKRQGLDPNQFIGQTLDQVFGSHAPIVKAHYERTFAGEEVTFELKINGQCQLYNAVPLLNDQKEIDRILVVVEDITDRKLAEEALLQSLEELYEVQQIARLGSWQVRLPEFRMKWSEEVFDIFDLDPADREPRFRRLLKLIHPDDRPWVKEKVREHLKPFQGTIKAMFRILCRNGSIRYLDYIAKQELNEAGVVVRLYGMVQDITDKKETELALYASQNKLNRTVSELEGILNAFPGMISVMDRDFNVLLANQEVIRRFGQSGSEDVLNKKCYKVRKGLSTICSNCALKQAMDQGKMITRTSTTEEDKLMGIASKAYAIPLRNEAGEIWGGAEVIVDISDIRQAEYEIKESEERYKRLAEAAFEGIGISKEGRIVDVNSRILEIYQMSREEFMSKSLSDLVHPDDRSMVMKKIQRNIHSAYEHRGIRRDGSVIYLEVRANPITIKNKTYRLTVIRDITERKKTENALREKVAELEQFNQAIADHETRMIKLKREVNQLCRQLGRSEKYSLQSD